MLLDMKRKKKEFRYLLDLKELKSGLEEQMEKLALYIQPENKKEVLKMTVKEIVEKVNRMILSKDSEEYEWLYEHQMLTHIHIKLQREI